MLCLLLNKSQNTIKTYIRRLFNQIIPIVNDSSVDNIYFTITLN